MVRKRVESGLKSWEEADLALLEIGRLDREIEAYEAELQRSIEAAKDRTVRFVRPLLDRKSALEWQLQAFCEARKGEFKGKSRVLNFGRVSFHLGSRIVIRGVAACVEALKSLGLAAYVRVKEAPDKDKMKDLDDATLAQVGAKRVTEDVFGYEVDRERVKDAA
jgi:phage host-nuclease inhibitor protein Gam